MSKRTNFLFQIARLLAKAEELGIELICYTFFRSAAEQYEQYKAGRSTLDGYEKKSKHQLWLAMDFVILDAGEEVWGRDPRYTTLGEFWESIGGIWGGRWEKLGDIYHFEI